MKVTVQQMRKMFKHGNQEAFEKTVDEINKKNENYSEILSD